MTLTRSDTALALRFVVQYKSRPSADMILYHVNLMSTSKIHCDLLIALRDLDGTPQIFVRGPDEVKRVLYELRSE